MKTYFKDIEGVEFQTIMWTASNVVDTYYSDWTGINGEFIIKPISPEPFKFWYQFFLGEKNICTIKRESELIAGVDGHLEPDEIVTYLEWYDDDTSFVELAEEAFGFDSFRQLYPEG